MIYEDFNVRWHIIRRDLEGHFRLVLHTGKPASVGQKFKILKKNQIKKN